MAEEDQIALRERTILEMKPKKPTSKPRTEER